MIEKAGRHTPIMITGDMNTSWSEIDERRESIAQFFEWMWSAREESSVTNPDVRSYNGFGEGIPTERWNLDHIFYRNVTPLTFSVIDSEEYGVKYISDHYPITFTLRY